MVTVWKIMVQGHQRFANVWNRSSKFIFISIRSWNSESRSSHPEVFLEKDVLKTCSKFTGEQWKKLRSNFIETTLRHQCSPKNLLHIFRAPFLKNTSGWLLLWIPRVVTLTGIWLFRLSTLTQIHAISNHYKTLQKFQGRSAF